MSLQITFRKGISPSALQKGSVEYEECGVRSAECGVRSAECGVRSAECGVRSAENEECRKFQFSISISHFRNVHNNSRCRQAKHDSHFKDFARAGFVLGAICSLESVLRYKTTLRTTHIPPNPAKVQISFTLFQ